MLKQILVPLELSAVSEAKLPLVEDYARAFQANVLLLHVLPEASGPRRPEVSLLKRQAGSPRHEGSVSPEEAHARTFLDTLTTRLRVAGCTVRSLVRSGPAAETILAVATEEQVELIVIGSNARRGISRRLLGSVAEAVVRQAACPVLLVRPAPEASLTVPAVRAFAADATRAGLLAPRALGLRDVDVARIIGSVGRASELGADFRPLLRRAADDQRYELVRKLVAGEANEVIGPIELYKLGYGYYVVDGHRRVAAAKELGQDEIPAIVTEFVPTEDATAQKLFTTRRAFERATGLLHVGAALPDNYARLKALIDEYAAHEELTDPREAAERWRNRIFRPLTQRIRTLGLNHFFPGERSADIIVRLADHRRAEAGRLGREVSWDEALDSFATAPRGMNAP